MKKHYLAAAICSICTTALFTSAALHAAIPADQQAALKSIYEEAGGESLTDLDWTEGNISCSSYGISCDSGENVVGITIDVVRAQADDAPTGLSARVADLINLESIELVDSRFTEPLPESIASLSKLNKLYIDGAWRSGSEVSFPSWIGSVASLETLFIVGSGLSGELPSDLGQSQSKLRDVVIAVNPSIAGPLPLYLANALQLERLDLNNNNLSGSVPEAWGTSPYNRVLDFINLSGNQLHSDNAIILAAIGEQLVTEPAVTRIVSHQYLGETEVAISWKANNDSGAQVNYSVFSRNPGDKYQLIDEGFSSDRHWRGTVPGLSLSSPQEIQIRELDDNGSTSSETVLIDTSVTNHAPTFDHPAQNHILTLPLGEQQVETPGWAYNMTDGDAGDHYLDFESDNIAGGYVMRVSNPSGTLHFGARYQSNGPEDGLTVLKLCDFSDLIDPLGACSAEEIFILRHADGTPGKENLPSFSMPLSLDAGSDYNFHEHEGFATNPLAGNNATATSYLLYHNLWTTNSHLFEIAPWISSPSGSLRFQFKEGVTGTSQVYFTLADHDRNSPDNGSQYNEEITPDHAEIHVLEISVGDARTVTTAADVRIAALAAQKDTVVNAATDSEVAEGGGGAGGLPFLGLGLIVAARRRR